MSRTCLFAMLILMSCHEDEKAPIGASVHIAALRCGKRVEQMQWLRALIIRSENDLALSGDIYSGSYDGQVVFIHQPMVMSCLACIVYDCDGNQLDRATLDPEKLYLMIDRWHRIYSPRDIN